MSPAEKIQEKEPFMMESSIAEFHKNLYNNEIKIGVLPPTRMYNRDTSLWKYMP